MCAVSSGRLLSNLAGSSHYYGDCSLGGALKRLRTTPRAASDRNPNRQVNHLRSCIKSPGPSPSQQAVDDTGVGSQQISCHCWYGFCFIPRILPPWPDSPITYLHILRTISTPLRQWETSARNQPTNPTPSPSPVASWDRPRRRGSRDRLVPLSPRISPPKAPGGRSAVARPREMAAMPAAKPQKLHR